jgi:ribulose-phosphate 3-epimerase
MRNVSICPTVTAETTDEYLQQMQRVEPFATRIHVDITDGDFAPHKLVNFDQVWWRGNRTIDLHIMHRYPLDHAEIILAMSPRLVIVHAEAEGNLMNFIDHLHRHGIEVGLALLPRTKVEDVAPALAVIDHVLIFSGNLGYHGGQADLDLLGKARKVRELNPKIEIGWDGGVNDQNAREIAEAGVDVLNVGGFIQGSENPQKAYATLKALVDY